MDIPPNFLTVAQIDSYFYLVSTWFLSLLVGVAFLTLESLLLALACSLQEQFIGCSQLAYNVNILELNNINRSSSAHAGYKLS